MPNDLSASSASRPETSPPPDDKQNSRLRRRGNVITRTLGWHKEDSGIGGFSASSRSPSPKLPKYITQAVLYLNELYTGIAVELSQGTPEWRTFKVDSKQFTELLEYLQENEPLLWEFWNCGALKYNFNYNTKRMKFGPLGQRHQGSQSRLGIRFTYGATDLAATVPPGDDIEEPLCGGDRLRPGALLWATTHPTILNRTTLDSDVRFPLPDVAFKAHGEIDAYLILEVADSEEFGDLKFSGHEYLLRSDGIIRHMMGLKMEKRNKLVRFGIWGLDYPLHETRSSSGGQRDPIVTLLKLFVIREKDGSDGPDEIIKIPLEWYVSVERAKRNPAMYASDRTVDVRTLEILQFVKEAEKERDAFEERARAAHKRDRDEGQVFRQEPGENSSKAKRRFFKKKDDYNLRGR